MENEIKEISKIDKQLLDKIEHILGSELSSEEYDKFYNYFNEIRKPNILIDIKDVESIKDYITNLQEENEKLKNGVSLEKASDKTMILTQKSVIEQLKTRNEKAINCINHYATENDDYSKLYSTEEEELLEILQGKSDE